jgi:hypothetical protein
MMYQAEIVLQEVLLFLQQLHQQVVVMQEHIIIVEVNQVVLGVELQEVINQQMQIEQLWDQEILRQLSPPQGNPGGIGNLNSSITRTKCWWWRWRSNCCWNRRT